MLLLLRRAAPPPPWSPAAAVAGVAAASTATTSSSIRRRRRPLPPPLAAEAAEGRLLVPWLGPPCRHKHTSQWMQRHVRDPYVRAARKDDLRSRAAFKLKEMQEKCRIVRPGDCVVDVGCAPGGWSEVAVGLVKGAGAGGGIKQQPQQQQQQQSPQEQRPRRPPRQGRVIGVDLLPVQPPVLGATLLQGDFTDPASRAELLRLATAPEGEAEGGGGGKRRGVDVVLSDLAPNFTGDAHTDHVRTLQLCEQVFDFAAEAFSLSMPSSSSPPPRADPQKAQAGGAAAAAGKRAKGAGRGTVLCKLFKGRKEASFLARVRASYAEVRLLKPKASRSESSETYVLARGFLPPAPAAPAAEAEEAGGNEAAAAGKEGQGP